MIGESATSISVIPDTQLIVSMVIKYNELEVLYDYSEVLDRRLKSVQQEISEENEYLKQAA